MTDSDQTAALAMKSEFRRMFAAEPRVFRAPGRVNLIGEHTDYNQGFVMPAAIGFATRAAIAPRADRTVEVYSRNYAERAGFELDDPTPTPRRHWSDYVRGVCLAIERSGRKLRGSNLLLDGEVPIGSGLSSSAALEVATAFAFLAASGAEADRTTIALLCQRAENEFVGTRSGIMDQFVACFGRAQHALLLDCRSLEASYAPIAAHLKLVVCDTGVRHELASSEYNRRREECEIAVRELAKVMPGLASLRDVSAADLAKYGHVLDPVIYRRCRHVASENTRVLAAAEALDRGDLIEVGKLLGESHRSLRDDYEVSSAELDLMVELAAEAGRGTDGIPGIYGSRMTGGGFGGSTINLVEAGSASRFADVIARRYRERSGNAGAVYVCSAADGAREEI